MQAHTNIMTSYFLGAIYIAIHSAIEIVRNMSWKKWAELRLDDEIVYYYYYSIPITWCKSKPTRYGITHSMIYKVNLWYSCICECANAPFVAYANECSMKFSLLTILNQWNIRCIQHLTVNLKYFVAEWYMMVMLDIAREITWYAFRMQGPAQIISSELVHIPARMSTFVLVKWKTSYPICSEPIDDSAWFNIQYTGVCNNKGKTAHWNPAVQFQFWLWYWTGQKNNSQFEHFIFLHISMYVLYNACILWRIENNNCVVQ